MTYHLLEAIPKCNGTEYVYNLTASYANQWNEATTVATSVAMFLLAALFFILNLYSRFSDISPILKPSIRFFLSSALALFLPVMSYLFSEAKNEGGAGRGQRIELSLRARTILSWMLLVELLRKKVEEFLVIGGTAYSGTIERATRIGWLGYLVFHSLRSSGKKALYSILWVLAAAKLVQRFVTSELAKRSFAYGKNPRLLASYMAQMLQEEQLANGGCQLRGSELLKGCKYVVMGEEDLEKEAGPCGYHLELTEAIAKDDSNVVTVGKIWRLAEGDPRLKRLCLSFALYKLLRRRLEDFPITPGEARNCHDLIFNGLCEEEPNREARADALFQVFDDEVHFLCEHYHSIHPVVFASPFFFLVNYILFPIVVWTVCILSIILCSNGDVLYAFHSFRNDNYAISVGILDLTGCILKYSIQSAPDLFTVVTVSITILLIAAFVYEEVWEFILFLFSNWFLVSLLCGYTSNPQCRASRCLRRLIRCMVSARDTLSQRRASFKQFSVLWFFRLSWALPTEAVPTEAKEAIMERLLKVSDANPPSNGRSVLTSQEHQELVQSAGAALSRACESASIADVILTWHIATALLEAKHPLPKKAEPGASRKVATALSGYCAYLVAFHPELLPDDRDGTERVYEDMKKKLKEKMGCWRYYCSPPGHRYDKLMEIAERRQAEVASEEAATAATTLGKGARLGKVLIDKYDAAAATDEDARERVWKLLADVWTEVVVYVAPAVCELQVKAHREALAQGGEFITVLWALATHTGIARPVATPASA
ncbi:hypothetical protein ACP70R_042171 [Stipagrostis hirtigluma subsp. patula]